MKMLLAATALLATTGLAQADKLDDIIASGTLRCAVVLDFPPMGFRDESNNPQGFDVDYCNDLAAALGVTAEIVETPFPERIPALMSGSVDVAVASTSDTLERAKTVGFTIPYYAFENAVVANDKSGITGWEGMKGKVVGATAGTYEAIWLEGKVKEWGEGEFRPYQTQADVFLALSQGQLDATVSTSTVAKRWPPRISANPNPEKQYRKTRHRADASHGAIAGHSTRQNARQGEGAGQQAGEGAGGQYREGGGAGVRWRGGAAPGCAA